MQTRQRSLFLADTFDCIHFAEGQILSRDGKPPPIWEKWARKDMYNIGRLASNDVKVLLRFEDFLGSYVEHCHNTTHEDYAMMLRFDVLNPANPKHPPEK